MAKTNGGRDLTSELAFLTRALKAPSLAAAIPRLAERAQAESWSHEEFLAACLQREVAARESHGGEGRIRGARFPARKRHGFAGCHGVCGDLRSYREAGVSSRVEVFEQSRRDGRVDQAVSAGALAKRYRVSRRTVAVALLMTVPPPRRMPSGGTRLSERRC
jgi:hypothetical protein